MLRCEAEVMDAMDAMLMADTELMAEIEAQLYEEMENIKPIYPLYKVCTMNCDATISDIYLTVYCDDTETEVYKGIAKNYPYEWETPVSDYQIYNIDNTVYLDVWCTFDKWRNIEIDNSDMILFIDNSDKTDIFNTPFGEMTKEEFNNWKIEISNLNK